MTQTILLVNYGSGNIRSAENALIKAITDGGLDARVLVSDKVADVEKADRIFLPGVGAFGACRAGILEREGLWVALDAAVTQDKKPFMGICVGMQLLFERGLEFGEHAGFGWLQGEVSALKDRLPEDSPLKIPHMGWNSLEIHTPHPIAAGLEHGEHMYFVHSYAATGLASDTLIASCTYGTALPAIVGKGNVVGTQFHPEKSQRAGQILLSNFIQWTPQ